MQKWEEQKRLKNWTRRLEKDVNQGSRNKYDITKDMMKHILVHLYLMIFSSLEM